MTYDEQANRGLLPIGEAAKRLGVSVATLRVWDRQGLLKPTRTLGGHRRYSVADLERVRRGSEALARKA